MRIAHWPNHLFKAKSTKNCYSFSSHTISRTNLLETLGLWLINEHKTSLIYVIFQNWSSVFNARS